MRFTQFIMRNYIHAYSRLCCMPQWRREGDFTHPCKDKSTKTNPSGKQKHTNRCKSRYTWISANRAPGVHVRVLELWRRKKIRKSRRSSFPPFIWTATVSQVTSSQTRTMFFFVYFSKTWNVKLPLQGVLMLIKTSLSPPEWFYVGLNQKEKLHKLSNKLTAELQTHPW